MSYTYINGTTVRIYTSTPFTSISGIVIDPDVVTFEYSVQGQASQTFTYTAGATPPDPTFTIVRTVAGTYQADFSTTGLVGTWAYKIQGAPGPSGLDTTKTAVVWNGEFIVSPSNP